jgi:tetratricopeptide (TPR) repeat protein
MENAENYLNEALIEYNAKNHTAAITKATMAINAGCTEVAAFQIRGLSYYYLQQYSQCIGDFTVYLKIMQDDVAMLMFRGQAYSMSKQPELALVDMNTCVLLQPEKSEVYQSRGYFLLSLAKYNEAIEDLSKAISIHSKNPLAYFHRGTAYFNIKDYQAAFTDLSYAGEFLPEQTEIFYLRGLLFYFKQDYANCINDMSRVIYLDENHPFARFYRMFSYLDSEMMEQAQYDANEMVKAKTTPFTFTKHKKMLPIVSMTVEKGKINYGLDTSPIGVEEQADRSAWQNKGDKKLRPIKDVTISLHLPQGGINSFEGIIVEEKY